MFVDVNFHLIELKKQNNKDECHSREPPQKPQHHGGISTDSDHQRVVHLGDKVRLLASSLQNEKGAILKIATTTIASLAC